MRRNTDKTTKRTRQLELETLAKVKGGMKNDHDRDMKPIQNG